MNWVDVVIILFLISALVRGRDIGFVQQFFSSIGFVGGLLLGAALEPHTVQWVHSPLSRSLVTLATTLGTALLFLGLGEYIGVLLKQKLRGGPIDRADSAFGSGLGFFSALLAVWLGAAIINTLPFPRTQANIRDSYIVSTLNQSLPPAPTIIADIGHLINPNGFPDVFNGAEPNPPDNINLPSTSALAAAVTKDRPSVVKIEGSGCGGIVEGTGFVVGSEFVATNAHVVAGINRPYVLDANGTHSAVPIWFDPNLDFAVLRVSNLAGQPLIISNSDVARGTAAAVLGYPGGGNFTAEPASVLAEFTATGRNIYNQGISAREIYEIAGRVVPGNSGGPLVATDGSVIGVVFAESTSYNNVGYTLTTDAVTQDIQHAVARNQAISTGNCAE